MKKCVLLIALVSLLALGGQATAVIGTIDNVPASTLLLPYFEVDLASSTGINTLFSVNNASAAPVLAHVTIWSEWSVPIIDFDIYLTGYDVQTLSVRDIIVNGILPQTGFLISNQGQFSDLNVNFPGCNTGTSPPAPPIYGPISASFLTLIQQSLSGQPRTFDGLCAATPGDETIARGYITIDTVNACTQEFPNSPGYFVNGGVGIATNQNVLWGDYFLLDVNNNFAQGFALVHIEAQNGLNFPCAPGDENTTFYCRYSLGEDNREALGSKYAIRFIAANEFFTGGSSILSYRDPSPNANYGVLRSCTSPPPTLTQANVTVFDEEENPITLSPGPSGEPEGVENPFRREANRTVVGIDLSVSPFGFGWVFLNLNGANTPSDVVPNKNQAYVAAVLDALGLFSVGYDAIQLNNLTGVDLGPAAP